MAIKRKLLKGIGLLTLFGIGFVSGAVFLGALVIKNQGTLYREQHPQIPPTGSEVLLELNKYRKEQGLPDFILSQSLCNNIRVRWQNYKDNNSHQGFNDFIRDYMPHNIPISEILAPGKTASETVKNWADSPGHNLAIKSNSKVCIYSADGLSIGLLSN